MPYTTKHKQQTREKILQSAAKLFSHQGFDNISIDDLMKDAGLTRGAFYNHFSDKSHLYAEAIVYAAKKSPLIASLRQPEDKNNLSNLLKGYLSHEHIEHTTTPCPLAFLSSDVNHRDPIVRNTYTKMYKNMLKLLTRLNTSNPSINREKLMAVTAMMIGGVAIAHALDDKNTSDELLSACRTIGTSLLEK